GMVSTYNGRRFFTFDMLFTGLQSHAQRRISMNILAYTYNTAGHRTFQFIPGRKESSMRATVSHRHTHSLRGTKYNVGAPHTRGHQHTKSYQVGSNSHLTSGIMNSIYQ